uniref:Uncharacterized protein n=1 Tax=Timema shepardi TaxID=629360 RepID=A0A7R9G7C7_TIMSH|nr:unnamed protein product [Timema shepardi]
MSVEDNLRSSKSRRNLFKRQEPIDPSRVQNETCLLEGGVAPPKSIHRRPYGTCSRLTRSSTKQWQEMFGQDKSTRRLDNDMMKPPEPPPLQPQLRGGTTGVVTRTRYRNLVRDVPQLQPATKTLKLSNACGSLLFDSFGNTSDYGTASDDSKNCSVVTDRLDQDSVRESCHCSSVSGMGSVQSEAVDMIEEDVATDSEAADLSNTGWDSDCGELGQPCVTVEMDWDSEAELECLRKVRESAKVVMICEEKVTAIIPTINPSGYRGKYRINLNTENDGNSYRQGLYCGLRVHHVSPVVSMEPHGVQFYETLPALLVIPLEVEPQEESWLSCLYSNTPEKQTPQWQRLPKKDFFYK